MYVIIYYILCILYVVLYIYIYYIIYVSNNLLKYNPVEYCGELL